MNLKIISELKSKLGLVKLMAVTKCRTADEIQQAFSAGQRLFGENHVQEIRAKFDPSTNPLASQVQCEMIGRLQRNKVRDTVRLCSRIDSVDSLALAQKIDSEAQKIGKTQRILIEINTSLEPTKGGFYYLSEAQEALGKIREMKNIRIEGFMTVGPVQSGVGTPLWEQQTHEAFAKLRNFSIEMKKTYPDLDLGELSMGMSADWKIAVEEGSTMVRIGTLIFGPREAK